MRLPNQSMPVNRGIISTARLEGSGVMPSDWNVGFIGASIENGQACVDLPFVGRQCISLPFLPNIGSAEACKKVRPRSIYGIDIPTGVCVDVKVSGSTVAGQCFGI